MPPTRDSSVWRSLAVAFGDGLAFGVGMKLTHPGSVRPAATAPTLPQPEPMPVSDRLALIERRLAEAERLPARTSPPRFDQQVLEAVVHALDSKLRDQEAKFEQRLAQLETKIAAGVKELRQQDYALATAVETHIETVQDHFVGQVEAVRLRLEQDRVAIQQEVASTIAEAFGGENAASMNRDFEQQLDAIRRQLEEEREARRQEIAELRQRAEQGDAAMFELLNGMGELIQRMAARKSPADPDPAAAPAAAQDPAAGRLWRVPLVSSMAVALTVAGAVLMHYF